MEGTRTQSWLNLRSATYTTLLLLSIGILGSCTDEVPALPADLQEPDLADECSQGLDCPDRDGDGFPVLGICCPQPPEPVDCDDSDPLSHPGGMEICGDGHDNNCDGSIDDAALCTACVPECQVGEAACSGPTRISLCELVNGCPMYASPTTCPPEQGCRDDACIPVCLDRDGDGFFEDCGDRDCDDTRTSVHPSAPELCDGRDNNCDRRTDENFVCDEDCEDECSREEVVCTPDGQGFVSCELTSNGCWVQTGRVLCPDNGYCVTGTCGLEPTCQDQDGDGFGPACSEGTNDCRPVESEAFPGADEICDGRDNDCDGFNDEGNVCASCTPSSFESPLTAVWGAPVYRVSCASPEIIYLGNVDEGDRVSVVVGGAVSADDVRLGVRVGANLTDVASAFPLGESVAVLYEASSRQELYLLVELPRGSAFTAVASREPASFACANDSFEPNDSPTLGTPIGGPPFAVTGTICGTDRDFYGFSRRASLVLSASLASDGGNGRDLSVSIYRNGVLLSPGFSGPAGLSGFPDGYQAFARMDLPGEYVVEVRGLGHETNNDYALTLQALDLPDCEDDPGESSGGWDDDSFVTAQDLAPDTEVLGTICPGDYDVYRVGHLSAGSHLTANLTHGPDMNLDGRMLRDGWIGLVQEAHGDGTTERFDNGISSDGVYYFVIYGRTARDEGPYRFRYSR